MRIHFERCAWLRVQAKSPPARPDAHVYFLPIDLTIQARTPAVNETPTDLNELRPIVSSRTKSGYFGVYAGRGRRWQAQVDHRSIGGYASAWEAGVAVTAHHLIELANAASEEVMAQRGTQPCLEAGIVPEPLDEPSYDDGGGADSLSELPPVPPLVPCARPLRPPPVQPSVQCARAPWPPPVQYPPWPFASDAVAAACSAGAAASAAAWDRAIGSSQGSGDRGSGDRWRAEQIAAGQAAREAVATAKAAARATTEANVVRAEVVATEVVAAERAAVAEAWRRLTGWGCSS